MSWYTYLRAKKLLKKGLVEYIGGSTKSFYFKVKDYDVTIPKKEGKFNCTCQYFSLWGVQKNCSHIEVAKMFIERITDND